MARIVIASASEENRMKLFHQLSSSGFSVFRCCASGSELRRIINECDDCVVILLGNLPDCKPDELQWDYGNRIQILLIARPGVLEACESPQIFRLTLPASIQAVIGAVGMLNQLHQMQLPKRKGSERETVEQAKMLLMRTRHLTEPEAHRTIQQYAMDHGMKMTEYAAQLLQSD